MPQPIPALPDYSAGYRAERERSRAEMNQRANYASAIAESLGYYTPELEKAVLEPMGKYPTIAENIFGAPVRAIGKLTGRENLQHWLALLSRLSLARMNHLLRKCQKSQRG